MVCGLGHTVRGSHLPERGEGPEEAPERRHGFRSHGRRGARSRSRLGRCGSARVCPPGGAGSTPGPFRPISGQEELLMDLTPLLQEAVASEASDVHLRPDARPALRVDGRLRPVDGAAIPAAELERLALRMMPEPRALEFETTGDSDFGYEVEGVGRFRVNAFRHQGRVGLVMRLVREQSRTFDALGLPPVVRRIAGETRGLVLV